MCTLHGHVSMQALHMQGTDCSTYMSKHRGNVSHPTSQSSKMSSQVSLPLMPSLSSFCAVLKPLVPFSTMKAVIPWGPLSGAVLAYTTTVLACRCAHVQGWFGQPMLVRAGMLASSICSSKSRGCARQLSRDGDSLLLDAAAQQVSSHKSNTHARCKRWWRTLGPFVHHILVPFRMYLSPFFSARVRILTASEPAPGSLMDSAPMCSPAQMGTAVVGGWWQA